MNKTRSGYLIFSVFFMFYMTMAISLLASTAKEEAYYRGQDRGKLIDNSLDAWESIEKRHFDATKQKSFDDVERRHKAYADKKEKDSGLKIRDYSYREGSIFGNGKHQFDAKWSYSRYKYDEPDAMKQKGTMYGVEGQYTYRPSPEDYLYSDYVNTYRADVNYRWGNELTYSARESQAGSVMSPVKDYILDLRGIVGKEYTQDQFDVMLYSGIGKRYLNDMEKPKTSNMGYLSYGREASYYYLPVGFELLSRIDKGLEYTIKGEYDLFVYGQTISHGSDMDWAGAGVSEDTAHNQHKGYGLRGSLEIAKRSPSFDLVLEPFFEYWKIEGSDTSNALMLGEYVSIYEPPNFTVQTGLKLGVQF